ncbi:MAG: zinc ribbon domain-containing protein [Vicinamibacteria bacterium]|nr:zinc ribbon domain-containing protein [Vicinamibacteria bacterium]
MPLYEYRCESCEHQFEVIQKFSDPHVSVCPKCGSGPVVKLISSPAFTFKGTGFYITDYARKDQGKSGESSDKSDKTDKTDKTDKSDKADKGTESKPAASDTASTPSTTTTPKGD